MPAPTKDSLIAEGQTVASELERLDGAIKQLQAERGQHAERARALLEKNIPVESDRTQFYLCPATTVKVTAAPGLLSCPLISAELREKLTVVDVAKLKKFREGELIPDQAWSEFVTEESSTVTQLRSRDLRPAGPDRKKELLKAAA